MATDPTRADIQRSDSFVRRVSEIFGTEREPNGGRPSLADFERLYWPALEGAIAVAWRIAEPIDDTVPELRAYTMEPVRGVFPPAGVVFNMAYPTKDSTGVRAWLIGIDFDWTFRWGTF